MKFCIKNCEKNINSYLTAKSIKHFLPESEIYLFNFHKKEVDDISNIPNINIFTKIISKKTAYSMGNEFPGCAGRFIGFYFSEGINGIQNYFRDLDEPLVILDEDHFFTTGKTIKELENCFVDKMDLAWVWWPGEPGFRETDMAANILLINPKRLNSLFPVSEKREAVETLLGRELLEKVMENPELKSRKMTSRNYKNYFGDGMYTNNLQDIINELNKVGISTQ